MIYIFIGIAIAIATLPDRFMGILEKLVDRIPQRSTSQLVRQVEQLQQRIETLEQIATETEFQKQIESR